MLGNIAPHILVGWESEGNLKCAGGVAIKSAGNHLVVVGKNAVLMGGKHLCLTLGILHSLTNAVLTKLNGEDVIELLAYRRIENNLSEFIKHVTLQDALCPAVGHENFVETRGGKVNLAFTKVANELKILLVAHLTGGVTNVGQLLCPLMCGHGCNKLLKEVAANLFSENIFCGKLLAEAAVVNEYGNHTGVTKSDKALKN